jgi:hypothetical protein
MPSSANEVPSELLREHIVPEFLSILDDVELLEHPAQLERLAATMLIPLEAGGTPEEVGLAVLEAIASRGSATAASILAAIAALASEPLNSQARRLAQELTADGITAVASIAALSIRGAVRIEHRSGDAEVLVALLERDGDEDVQSAIMGIEHRETDGALVECLLSPPTGVDEAHELLEAVDGAAPPAPIDAEELTNRVIAAAQRSVELQYALGANAGPALPIIARALTGDAHGIPRPKLLTPWDDDDPELIVDAAEDEQGFHRLVETLLDELETHARANHPPGGVVWEHGDFIAGTMLEWKGSYADGRLGRWTSTDLAEYLIDYFPRKVTVHDETLDAVPDCVKAFLGFLEARGSLSGEPLEALKATCDELHEEFNRSARDSSGWGLAKSMVMQMQAEGVDPSEPGALDAWMDDFNARPREERDAVIGAAADRMARAAGLRLPGNSRRSKPKAQRRKAQKAARKRNR